MTTVDATIPANLRGAALYIERHGLHKGGFLALAPTAECPFPAACAGGAIRVAITGTALGLFGEDLDAGLPWEQFVELWATLDTVVMWVNPSAYDSPEAPDLDALVATWNDGLYMTADKVVKTLRAIAAQYEASHASTQ